MSDTDKLYALEKGYDDADSQVVGMWHSPLNLIYPIICFVIILIFGLSLDHGILTPLLVEIGLIVLYKVYKGLVQPYWSVSQSDLAENLAAITDSTMNARGETSNELKKYYEDSIQTVELAFNKARNVFVQFAVINAAIGVYILFGNFNWVSKIALLIMCVANIGFFWNVQHAIMLRRAIMHYHLVVID